MDTERRPICTARASDVREVLATENIGHDVEWTLEPIDGSYDLVLVRDKGGMAMGTLHVESFTTAPGQGELYEQLNDGHTVRVRVVAIE